MSLEIRSYGPGDGVPEDFRELHRRAAYRNPDEGLGKATAYVAFRGGRALARASAQMAEGLVGLEGRAGLIGHYEAEDAEAGRALLERLCADLKARGAAEAVGPMNGSTWRRYRLALEPRGGAERSPAFLGEPENPAGYARQFEEAGFSLREEYESRELALAADLPWDAYLPARVRSRYAGRIRPLDLGRYEEELGDIHDESSESFARNALYTPLTRAEFVGHFLPLKGFYDPDFVRLYRGPDGRVEGHVAAYPDGERVILKTLSCRERLRGLGLAHALSHQVHELAFKRGFKSVVHALMRVGNRSGRMSGDWGGVIRRYALFSRVL